MSAVGGSQQLRRFRIAVRDGAAIEDAAAAAGIELGEARLIVAEDAKSPPPPEAYELIGHNQPPKDKTMADASDDRLRLLIERVERLTEEAKGIRDDIKDVFAEAKATGYDVAIMKRVIKMRAMKPDDRREAEHLLLTYCSALGIETQGSLF